MKEKETTFFDYYTQKNITTTIPMGSKYDFLLENGRHRSTKMWYCRLYCTMMLQHLDAWEMPSIVAFQSLLSLDA